MSQSIDISSIYNNNGGMSSSYAINTNGIGGENNTGKNGNEASSVAWKNQVANRNIAVLNITDKAATANNSIRYAMSAMSLTGAFLPPTITNFSPASGCANTTPIVITGTDFSGATAVTFGSTNALSFVVDSDTQITATPASRG